MRNTYRNFEENLKARNHLGDIGVDEKMVSKWILNEDTQKVEWTRLGLEQ
jgi:hypothetical protein